MLLPEFFAGTPLEYIDVLEARVEALEAGIAAVVNEADEVRRHTPIGVLDAIDALAALTEDKEKT